MCISIDQCMPERRRVPALDGFHRGPARLHMPVRWVLLRVKLRDVDAGERQLHERKPHQQLGFRSTSYYHEPLSERREFSRLSERLPVRLRHGLPGQKLHGDGVQQ